MAEHDRRFPDPPPDVPLHVERLSDRLVVTIKPGPVVAGSILSHRTPPMPPGFRWIYRFIFIGGFASFLLFILMLLLMGAYVRETRLKLFAFGFAAYSSGIAALSVRVMRRGSFAPLVFQSGTFPWRLELSQRGWKTVYRNPLVGEHGHAVDPSKVKRLHVDDEHRVIAYEGEQLMILTPRLSPEIAKWLRDALYEQLDHDAREAVSKDLARS